MIDKTLIRNIVLSFIALSASFAVAELIVRNFVIVRNVGPSFTVYDHFYGKTLKKRFSARRITPEFTMKFTTNSDGFRGPEIGTLSSDPILFLGDSFTMGYGVNDGKEFPALVRKRLNEHRTKFISVINAGMGANGNGRWVKFLRTKAIDYSPAFVVLQIHANDFQDNIRERLFELSPAGELIELSVPSQSVKRKLQFIVDGIPGLAKSYLIGLSRQISLPGNSSFLYPVSDNPHVDSDRVLLEEQLLFRLMEKVLSICNDRGWRVLVVLVGISDKRILKMESFFSGYSVSTLVIPGKRDRPDLYYKMDGHWNASGHRFAADRILEVLEKFHIKN